MNQTSQLQSRRSRNAMAITALITCMIGHRAEAKVAQYKPSRKYHRDEVKRLRTAVTELAQVQKNIKRDLLAAKYARLQQAGVVRSKHGMDDPRFDAWLRKGHDDAHEYALGSNRIFDTADEAFAAEL